MYTSSVLLREVEGKVSNQPQTWVFKTPRMSLTVAQVRYASGNPGLNVYQGKYRAEAGAPRICQ